MQRTLCLLLTLGLATTTLLPALEAHAQDATTDVKLYLNRASDGSLVLTSNAPSARNATTWTTSGTYSTSRGLDLRIELVDPNPNWVIDEDQGVDGWITWSFKQTRSSSVYAPLQSYNYGSFQWLLVEGDRSSRMLQECAAPNQTHKNRCDAYQYAADFPGHAGEATPHTHGDGANASRGLLSGDLEWVLSYTIPPCASVTSLCGTMGSTMRYEFSVVLDGTTFLHYAAIDEEHPDVAPSNETAPIDNETAAGNGTAPGSGGSGNETGNQTGNETGADGQGNAFRPRAYNAQPADGTAPGAGLAAIFATLAAGMLLRRRRTT